MSTLTEIADRIRISHKIEGNREGAGATVARALINKDGQVLFDASPYLTLSEMLAGLGAQPSIDFGSTRIIYVSKGSAATDTRTGLSKYDESRPFATITAAKNAATAGEDIIFVKPGTYDEGRITKPGVPIHLSHGVIIDYSGNEHAIVSDEDGALTGKVISGAGVLKYSASVDASDVEHPFGPVVALNPSTDCTIECARIENNAVPTSGVNYWAVWTKQNNVLVKCDSILVGDNSYGVGWDGGQLVVVAPLITGGNLGAIGYGGTNSGDLFVLSQRITSTGTNATIYADSLDPESIIWVQSSLIQNTAVDGFVVQCTSGKSYINSQKAKGIVTQMDGKLWFTTQKLTSDSYCMALQGGFSVMDVKQYELLTPSSNAIISFSDDNVTLDSHILPGRLQIPDTVANVTGVDYGGGVVRLQGLTLDVSKGGSTSKPINLSASGLIIDACTLVAGSSGESIASDSPRTAKIYGTTVANNGKGADVKLQVNEPGFIVDSDVT